MARYILRTAGVVLSPCIFWRIVCQLNDRNVTLVCIWMIVMWHSYAFVQQHRVYDVFNLIWQPSFVTYRRWCGRSGEWDTVVGWKSRQEVETCSCLIIWLCIFIIGAFAYGCGTFVSVIVTYEREDQGGVRKLYLFVAVSWCRCIQKLLEI